MHTPAPDLSLMKKRESDKQRVHPLARRSSNDHRRPISNDGTFSKTIPRVDSVFGATNVESLAQATTSFHKTPSFAMRSANTLSES